MQEYNDVFAQISEEDRPAFLSNGPARIMAKHCELLLSRANELVKDGESSLLIIQTDSLTHPFIRTLP
jgi:hypothetical protein